MTNEILTKQNNQSEKEAICKSEDNRLYNHSNDKQFFKVNYSYSRKHTPRK